MNRLIDTPITVLVVDDDEHIRELLKSFLEQKHMHVLLAESAEEALAREDLDAVQVALLDIRLPGRIDGHQLQKELNRRFPDMAKILMSGHADLDDAIAAFSDQAFSFARKPFSSLKEIAVLIERAAEIKQLEAQNRDYAARLEEANRQLSDKVTETTAKAQRYQNILSHLYLVSSQLGRIEHPDGLLDFICQSVIEAGAFRRAVVLLADEKYLIRNIGVWDASGVSDGLRETLRQLKGQPLRPFEFDRPEKRIGTAVYAQTPDLSRPSQESDHDTWRAGDQLFVPILRQDSGVTGFLSLEAPTDGAPPSEDIIELLEVLLGNAGLYLEAQKLRNELKKRADELELRVQERTKELRLSEERFSRLVNTTTDIVYIADENDKLTFINEAFSRVTGYLRENYLGRTLKRLFEDITTDNPINNRALQEISSRNAEHMLQHVEVVTRQGDKRTLEINRTLISQGGVVRGSQGIIRDITEHRKLLQQLVASERLAATGRLAAGIAHEINNPLQAMISQIAAVDAKLTEGKNPLENVELLRESVDRIKQIVRSMLDLHRGASLPQKSVNLKEISEKVGALVSQQIHQQSIRLRLDIPEELPNVTGSAQELQQVLLNLVLNAIEAMPRGGDLIISGRTTVKTVDVNVKDTGVGIAAEHLQQIFEPFFTFRTSGSGTGLGLYLCRNIMEAHRGKILVQSERGKGSTFTLSFPRE
ncbi:response regulator [candidate division KSB1 bacterium]|nr:MAG: response regulator [candidate division KSB1 bacterium]